MNSTENKIKNRERLEILFDLMGPEAYHTGYKKMTDSEFNEFVASEKEERDNYRAFLASERTV